MKGVVEEGGLGLFLCITTNKVERVLSLWVVRKVLGKGKVSAHKRTPGRSASLIFWDAPQPSMVRVCKSLWSTAVCKSLPA